MTSYGPCAVLVVDELSLDPRMDVDKLPTESDTALDAEEPALATALNARTEGTKALATSKRKEAMGIPLKKI